VAAGAEAQAARAEAQAARAEAQAAGAEAQAARAEAQAAMAAVALGVPLEAQAAEAQRRTTSKYVHLPGWGCRSVRIASRRRRQRLAQDAEIDRRI